MDIFTAANHYHLQAFDPKQRIELFLAQGFFFQGIKQPPLDEPPKELTATLPANQSISFLTEISKADGRIFKDAKPLYGTVNVTWEDIDD